MRRFRGLTKDGELVYGWYCKIEGIHYIIDNTVSHTWLEEDCYEVQGLIIVIPETVGQYTGLKDKSGKKGWQGDLITHFSRNGLEPIEIIWKDGSWQGKYLGKSTTEFTFILDQSEMDESEIIGNIHENPKLLSKHSG